jgi:hypothetical protein
MATIELSKKTLQWKANIFRRYFACPICILPCSSVLGRMKRDKETELFVTCDTHQQQLWSSKLLNPNRYLI